MNFVIIDNLFQILVLFGAMIASAVTACKRKSRDFLFLAGGYGCFMMGTLYYVLHLIIDGDVPQIFYVAEISWLAFLFFLSLSISRRSIQGRVPSVISISCAVLIVCLIFFFQIFGPALFFSLSFAVTEGTIVLRCMVVIRKERKKHLLDSILLLVSWLQVALYIVSDFFSDYTQFNFYFVVDMVLTLTMASMYFALQREVKRA